MVRNRAIHVNDLYIIYHMALVVLGIVVIVFLFIPEVRGEAGTDAGHRFVFHFLEFFFVTDKRITLMKGL